MTAQEIARMNQEEIARKDKEEQALLDQIGPAFPYICGMIPWLTESTLGHTTMDGWTERRQWFIATFGPPAVVLRPQLGDRVLREQGERWIFWGGYRFRDIKDAMFVKLTYDVDFKHDPAPKIVRKQGKGGR